MIKIGEKVLVIMRFFHYVLLLRQFAIVMITQRTKEQAVFCPLR